MALDGVENPRDGLRSDASQSVNPFHLAISELQGDSDTYEEPSGERRAAGSGPARTATPAPAATAPVVTRRDVGVILAGIAVVSLLGGLIGGSISGALVAARSRPAKPAEPPPVPVNPGPPPASAEEVQVLKGQAADLAKQLSGLAERLDAWPKPQPAPDLSGLRGQVSALEKATTALGGLPGKLDRLDDRASKNDRTIAKLREDLAGLTARLEKPPSTTASPVPAPTPPATTPPVATTPTPATTTTAPAVATATAMPRPAPAPTTPSAPEPRRHPAPSTPTIGRSPNDQNLARGAAFFYQGRTKEAMAIFNKLELTAPDDARVWYFSALCYGLATGEWSAGTERRAEKGREREEAGTPSKGTIDEAFHDLTKALGKPWLDEHRARVVRRPDAGR